MYYQFDIGVNNTATSIAMNGRMEGLGDDIGVYAYNWGTTSWNQIGNLLGVNPIGAEDGVGVFTLLNTHTGTGVNEGKVRIRGLGSGLTSGTLYLDRASLRYAPVPAPSVIDVRTEMDSNSIQLAAIVADTNELQSDNIPGTLATILADTNELQSDNIPTTLAAILADTNELQLANIPATLALILADTNELQTDDIPTTLATIAAYIDTEISTILTNLAIVDTVVDGIATSVSTVDTVVDGIQTDLDNGIDGLGALKALINTLDTVTDAVKAKTDQLTFTKTLELDTNIQSINGSTVVGDGVTVPWEGS